MNVHVKNTSGRRVKLRFTSGLTKYLAGGESLVTEHVEVKGNPRIARLVARRVIALNYPQPKKKSAGGRKASAPAASKAGRRSGTVTFSTVRKLPAPSEAAASSSDGSSCRKPATTAPPAIGTVRMR